jgi:transglutaminase-like putative cysteine protease
MVALFLLFPRIAPLWGVPQDAAGRTGLSGTLRLGGVAELASDDSIALRVRFFGTPPPPEAMYFRGPVLARFDGREWSRLTPSFPASLRPRADVQLLGAPLRYEMTLEPSRLPLLPTLELTPDRPDAAPRLEGWTAVLRNDLQWQLDRPVTERLRFEAEAWLLNRHGPRAPLIGLRDNVDLPAGYNPRTLAWAAALRRQRDYAEADARTMAAVVLKRIREGGFSYTLEPGSYGRDAVDEFWFDRRLGFCEHFAAAFVVVMRALDVPARIVTGYQGSDPAPVDGYWVVRQSHAHAWAEFWQPGEGWVRVDPTAAVAPERVQRGRSLQPRPGFVADAIGSVSPQLLTRLRGLLERVDNQWNQWVLNYSRGQQFELLRSLGVGEPDWGDLLYAMAGLLAAGSLGGVAWALYDRWRQDPWARLQRRVRYRLLKIGVTVQMHEAPRARAARVRAVLGARGEAVARTLEALELARYAQASPRKPDPRWWSTFRSAVQGAAAGR